MKLFHCGHCGQRVFFDNELCGNCGSTLGFAPDEQAMVAFNVGADGLWTRLGLEGPALRPCQNYAVEHVCNWMVRAEDPTPHCLSCRTTHIIPALGKPENRGYWAQLEHAKRRLMYTLIALNLSAPSKTSDPQHGLWFQFLEDVSPQQRVLTGHDEGVITLNIAEADDAKRETMRTAMHEPYRTLLGHFRHESGHYYWDRLVKDTTWIDEYRDLFGDERADYAQALQQHYANPLLDWQLSFISAYASAHPWEDWAECWAHYLHMVDGLDTAAAWGMSLANAVNDGPAMRAEPLDANAPTVQQSLIEQWLPVSQFINAMNRSLGSHDSYPFVVLAPVVAKLDFIHRVVGAAARGEMPMNFARPPDVGMVPVDAPLQGTPQPLNQPPETPVNLDLEPLPHTS